MPARHGRRIPPRNGLGGVHHRLTVKPATQMPITYRKDLERNYVHVEWIGDITGDILEPHFNAFFHDPFVLSSGRNLTDIRRARLKITGAQLHKLILGIAVPLLQGRRRRTAIVVQRKDQFGTARQYGLMAEGYSTDQIFHDCETALAWLLEQPATPSPPSPPKSG